MTNGVKTTNLTRQFAIDEVIGNVTTEGVASTVRIPFSALADQLAGTGTFVFGNTVYAATEALLDASTPPSDTAGGAVFADPDASRNGYYTQDGAGGWDWQRGFPDTVAVLENIGGTANAISADTAAGVNPADVQMIILPDPPGTNTSQTVTITLNGGAAEDIKAASGTDPAIGDIIAGVGTLFFRFGSEWRQLFSSATGATFDHQSTWAAPTTYTEGQVVTGSNGNWYQLKAASSIGDDPVGSVTGDWLQILAAAAIPDGSLVEAKFAGGAVSARAIDDTASGQADILEKISGVVRPVGGTADDTTEFQAALTAASGGVLSLLPGQTYTLLGTGMTLPADGLIVEGNGAAVHIDPPARVVNYWSSQGALGTSYSLTANADATDDGVTVSTADAANFAAGDFVLVGDTRYNGKYAHRIVKVLSVDAGTGVITFEEILGVPYTVALGGFIQKLTMNGGIKVRNVNFTFASDSDIDRFIYAYVVDGLEIEGCTFNGHRTVTAPSTQNTWRAEYCRGVKVSDNEAVGSSYNGITNGGGGFGDTVWCDRPKYNSNRVSSYPFAGGHFRAYAPQQNFNTFFGLPSETVRAMKAQACFGAQAIGNVVTGFATGCKFEDMVGGYEIANNVFRNCGAANADAAINLTNAETLVTPDGRKAIISGNVVLNQTGIGIIAESPTEEVLILGNFVDGTTWYGIYTSCTIGAAVHNTVRNFDQGGFGVAGPVVAPNDTFVVVHHDNTGNVLIGRSVQSATPARLSLKKNHAAGQSVLETETSTTDPSNAVSFRNPSGVVGSIQTNGAATAYNTSSEEKWKRFIGVYDPVKAIDIIRRDPVRDFWWDEEHGGSYAVGWGAQTSYLVSPDLASPGGWKDPITGEAWEEGGIRWVDDHGEPANEDDPGAVEVRAIYVPWSIDQGRRTPYLWAALTAALDRIDMLEARLGALEESSAG